MNKETIDSSAILAHLLTKAGLSDLYKLNQAALLGVLIEIKEKLASKDKITRKEVMQHYTNIGIQHFKHGK